MKRLDPTTLPGYQGEWSRGYAPAFEGDEYYRHGTDLVVELDCGSHTVPFALPLDILTEEQVIEILTRNRCPVP